jgi:benzil reductase ((S)-benzoin forming)
LNASILGRIRDLTDTPMEDVRQIMDINLWANKVIIDGLIRRQVALRQLILISSGSSVNGNRGWGVYSISKASLNMLAKLYAHEMPDTHITAYAPGLVHTQMQDYLCHDVDTEKFPSMANLVAAYDTDAMPDIDTAAQRIARSFTACLEYPSGSLLDIRQRVIYVEASRGCPFKCEFCLSALDKNAVLNEPMVLPRSRAPPPAGLFE